MGKRVAVIFALLCAVVALAVDFDTQAKRAGVAPSKLAVSDYLSGYGPRIEAYKAERAAAQAEKERQAAWRRGGKPFLPEAPAGYTRVSIVDQPAPFFISSRELSRLQEQQDSAVHSLRLRQIKSAAEKRERRGWVYQSELGVTWIEANLQAEPDQNGLTGLAASVLESQSFGIGGKEPEVLGLIDGVPFVEVGDRQERPYREFKGIIGLGERVAINVKTTHPLGELSALLQHVDLTGLNQLLSEPMPTVGTGFGDAAERNTLIARSLLQLRDTYMALRAEAAQLRIDNIDASALVANSFIQGRTGVAGALDITAGAAEDLSVLLEREYRAEAVKLLSPSDPQAGADAEAPAQRFGAALGEIGALGASIMRGISGAGRSSDADGEPPVVRVNKGLGQGSMPGAGTGCVRRGNVLSC